ncbi:MAG: TraB/GumN family protein [Parvularculaceae bacterium]|nr:TraB/GumN family protein [Parvularculaceae bacterium]
MKSLLTTGLALSAALLTSTAVAAPPMWTISDKDSTIVLFPTIHILPDELEWQSPEMLTALNNADEVWFELLPSEVEDQQLMQTLAIKYGMSPDKPLSQRLDPATYQEFSEVAASVGVPAAAIDSFRPWLAAVTLAVSDLVADGFNPEAGVEKVLAAMVPAEKYRALETADQQLGFFAGLSEEIELAFLEQTMRDIGRSAEQLRDLAQAWAVGDVSGVEELLLTSVREVSEELYDVLLVQRNANWAEQFEKEMSGAGSDFVAVGGGHLVGEDSVPMMMKKRGYKVSGPGFDKK